MSDSLATYLHDHLAGSHFAIRLLDMMIDDFAGEPLGVFAAELRAEVEEDQATLERIVQRVGPTHFNLAEAAGWLAQKASQWKLRRDDDKNGSLGSFESLETLSLGIRGKEALWKALARIRQFDATVPPLDFDELIARAQDQFRRVEERRLNLVPATFGFQTVS